MRGLIALLLLLLFFTGIQSAHPAAVRASADEPLITVQTPAGVPIQAEVADTPQKRAKGLMFRENLGQHRGMLFIFNEPQAWTFWMKNTRIPLDIIWMDNKKRIVHIEQNVPGCQRTDESCPQYRPNENAMYVLEIAAGTADGYKLRRGAKLHFTLP